MPDILGDISTPLKFLIAFAIVLALIGLTTWVVRRFGSDRLGGIARGRQPRLAVIDATTVDGRRRLVLIRRDNVEHLLMIGGPTDLVVEPNIVRAAGARDVAREPARGADATARPATATDGVWPLQPSTEPAAGAAPRPFRSSATEEPWLAPEAAARPRPTDSLTGMAAEFSARVTDTPARTEPAPRPSVPPPPAEPAAPAQTGHNLAEMAQQLEAALRRMPHPENRPPVTDPLAAATANPAKPPVRDVKPRADIKFDLKPKTEAKPEPAAEPKVEPKIEPKREPAAASNKAFDSLEEEMASLLGRPPGKT